MEWFSTWWDALNAAEQILYCIAIPATLILIIQTIMLLFGFGHGGEGIDFSDTSGIDFDSDVSGTDTAIDISDVDDISGHSVDGGNPADIGALHLFTIQGVVAFLCIFGWSGIVLVQTGLHIGFVFAISAVLGFLAMLGVAKIIQLSTKLTQNGSFNIKNILGEKGTVYLTIPPTCSGHGKITLLVGERFLEFSAMTDEEEAIPNNTPIRIVDIRGGDVAIVERTT